MTDNRPPTLAECGTADPYVHQTHHIEMGTLAKMTARVVCLPVFLEVGRPDWYYGIELGPYLFDHDDVEVLRQALADYDEVNRWG